MFRNNRESDKTRNAVQKSIYILKKHIGFMTFGIQYTIFLYCTISHNKLIVCLRNSMQLLSQIKPEKCDIDGLYSS